MYYISFISFCVVFTYLQALKEFKEKNPNWDDKQENKYKKIEDSIHSYRFLIASDKCIAAHHGLI